MIILWKNLFDLDSAVITSSGVSSIMGLSNLSLDTLCDFTRLLKGDQTLTLDCGVASEADCVAIAPHCMTALVNKVPIISPSIISAELYGSNDGFSTSTKICDIASHGGRNIYATFEKVTFRYYRIVFSGNKYHDIGKMFIGLKTDTFGQEPSQKLGLEHHTDKIVSKTGQRYTARKYESTRYSVSLPNMPIDDFKDFRAIWESVGDWKSIFAAWWEDELELMPMIYCYLDMSSADFDRKIVGDYYPSIDLVFVEAF